MKDVGWILYHLFDIPNKRLDTDLLVAFVELADGEHNLIDLIIFDNTHHGRVHLRPAVGATMGVTVHGTSTLDILPKGKAADVEHIKHVFHSLRVCLVENNHYGFHGSYEL